MDPIFAHGIMGKSLSSCNSRLLTSKFPDILSSCDLVFRLEYCDGLRSLKKCVLFRINRRSVHAPGIKYINLFFLGAL